MANVSGSGEPKNGPVDDEVALRKSVLKAGGWVFPDYRQGADELWDRLGEDWQAVDGVHEGMRTYVLWVREQPDARPTIGGLCFSGGRVTRELLRSTPIARLENLRISMDKRADNRLPHGWPPLERRKGDDPERFSERVASYYQAFAAISPSPTKDMSEHSQVPMPTMRGWIREARLRGKLPPGSRGKAG